MREALSVRAQMSAILRRLQNAPCRFSELLRAEQGAAYVVVSFIALLELAKEGLVRLSQPQDYGEIEIALNDGAREEGFQTASAGTKAV